MKKTTYLLSFFTRIAIAFIAFLISGCSSGYFYYEVDPVFSKSTGVLITIPGFPVGSDAYISLQKADRQEKIYLGTKEWCTLMWLHENGRIAYVNVNRDTEFGGVFKYILRVDLPAPPDALTSFSVQKILFEPEILWMKHEEKELRISDWEIVLLEVSNPDSQIDSFHVKVLIRRQNSDDSGEIYSAIYNASCRKLILAERVLSSSQGGISFENQPEGVTFDFIPLGIGDRKIYIMRNYP